jgi:type IV pilus assembly protein PilB
MKQLLSVFKKQYQNSNITQEEFEEIERLIETNSNVIQHVVQSDILTSKDVTQAIAETFNKRVVDLENYAPDDELMSILPEKLVRKYGLLPLSEEKNTLRIAAYNIFDSLAKSEVKLHLQERNFMFVFELAEYDHVMEKIEAMYDESMEYGDLTDDELESLEIIDESGGDSDEGIEAGANDAPIIKLSNKILLDAIRVDASDIHIEPYEKSYRIRYRADGILKVVMDLKKSLEPKLSARFKIMCSADISEKRRAQDGRIKMKLSKNRAIDFRVSILPTLFGEKIVMRKLDPTSAQMGIDALGYDPEQKAMFMENLTKPQGMILVTGPTGSGKTVSLYTGLNIINKPEINISTAEDPVEINLEGINQCNVNAKQGLDFSDVLRALLRQDPDIIMVGEIRDLETGQIAIKAAQTGHMVMSTLHTNSAAETITRLLNMGIPAFNVATTINLIIAQRLGRRLCTCKVPVTFSKDVLLENGFLQEDVDHSDTMFDANPEGCEKCEGNGYKGRVGIYEVVEITPRLSEAIMEGATSIDLAKIQQEEGFNTLRRSALLKALEGVTTLEEVNRVTQ